MRMSLLPASSEYARRKSVERSRQLTLLSVGHSHFSFWCLSQKCRTKAEHGQVVEPQRPAVRVLRHFAFMVKYFYGTWRGSSLVGVARDSTLADSSFFILYFRLCPCRQCRSKGRAWLSLQHKSKPLLRRRHFGFNSLLKRRLACRLKGSRFGSTQ